MHKYALMVAYAPVILRLLFVLGSETAELVHSMHTVHGAPPKLAHTEHLVLFPFAQHPHRQPPFCHVLHCWSGIHWSMKSHISVALSLDGLGVVPNARQ